MDRIKLHLLITVTVFVVALCARGGEGKAGTTMDYQKTADGARWVWSDESATPLGCVRQAGDIYDIRLLSRKNRAQLVIEVRDGDRTIYEWVGHPRSVFRILDDRLYYANFHPSSSGGEIVAVDLGTGKELWRSPLKALGPVQHSAYRNLLNLTANHEVVSVYGLESAGRYVEFKNARTGETVGHKLFPREHGAAK